MIGILIGIVFLYIGIASLRYIKKVKQRNSSGITYGLGLDKNLLESGHSYIMV